MRISMSLERQSNTPHTHTHAVVFFSPPTTKRNTRQCRLIRAVASAILGADSEAAWQTGRDACVKADSTAGVTPQVKRERHTDIDYDSDARPTPANTGPRC